jgi:hypothetical protein
VYDAGGVQRGKRLGRFVEQRCCTSRIESPGGPIVDEFGDGGPGCRGGDEPDGVLCGDEIRHRQHTRQTERLDRRDARGEAVRDSRILHQRRIEAQNAAQGT